MPVAEADLALVERILTGDNRELRLLAARGLLPLPPYQLIPLQARLARDPDPEVAGRATTVLRLTEPRLLADYLSAEAGDEELAYFAVEAEHPVVIEALLRRRDVPRQLLVDLAHRLDPALQEVLVLRQDAIIDEPAILDALEANPRLDLYVRRRIGEYRQHLLPSDREAEEAPAAPSREARQEEVSDQELAQALDEAAREPQEGEVDEITGLSEGQIRGLPVPVRMRLSRGASRTLRNILIRDTNARVAISVLVNNALGEEEVEQIGRSRVVVDEVLEHIARRREWSSRYGIVNALVGNPRTPVASALRLVPRLGVRDLRNLARNRNVPDPVRSAARQLFNAKTR